MTTAPFLPLLTTVLWTAAAGVGASGLLLAPAEPVCAVARPQPAPKVETLEVRLADSAAEVLAPAGADAAAAAAADMVIHDAPPAAPACAAMAAGSSVAFAIPVAAPASLVGKSAASALIAPGVVGGVPGGVAGGLPVTRITLGKGFGAGLPAPAYPEQARLNGWEGSVTIRFALDSSGRVLVAKIVGASGRPVLDLEALDTVRRRWKFPAGSPPGPFDWTAHFVLE